MRVKFSEPFARLANVICPCNKLFNSIRASKITQDIDFTAFVKRPLSAIFLVFFLLTSVSFASPFENDRAESQLINIINNINNVEIDEALANSKKLMSEYPKFRLAKLIYADLLNTRAGKPILANKDYLALYQEAKVRLKGEQSSLSSDNRIPNTIISVPPSIKYLLDFDLEHSRIYLIKNENQQLSVLDDHYISLGKKGYGKQFEGDNKTPVGVYKVTSYLEDSQLPELYGWGAFPINYPNTLDKLAGKTGHGIWLHGIPRETYSRPPKDSEGCVVLNNDSLKQLKKYIELQKTPIILSSTIEWQSQSQHAEQKNKFEQLFNNWHKAWENGDVASYINHYSKTFVSNNKNYEQWKQHKSRIIQYSSNIKVNISDRSMFLNPSDHNILHVEFFQNYQSDQYKGRGIWKEQIWKKENDGLWRITYEG